MSLTRVTPGHCKKRPSKRDPSLIVALVCSLLILVLVIDKSTPTQTGVDELS